MAEEIKKPAKVTTYMKELRNFALSFPETHEEDFCGRTGFKVRKKIFSFMSVEGDKWRFGVKLNTSLAKALELSFTEPTHGGFGKHGWVTSYFDLNETAPLKLLFSWLEESYCAVAPEKALKKMEQEKSSRTTCLF